MQQQDGKKSIEKKMENAFSVTDRGEQREALHAAASVLSANERVVQEGIGSFSCSAIDDLRESVLLLSGGTNTVLVDDRGLPSIMVYIPAMMQNELDPFLPAEPHPVFTAFGKPIKGIFLSKFQNIVVDGRGYSLPMRDPASELRYIDALAACQNKGRGWGLSPYGLRAVLALWAISNNLEIHGNNSMGNDYYHPQEQGIATKDGRVATGSGPLTWSHNGRPSGVWDLNGNLNEWDSGIRLVDSEIQIEPGCESLFEPENEERWKAILPNGSLVSPGSARTLKYRGVAGGIQVTCGDTAPIDERINCAFHEIGAEPGLDIPDILKSYALYPPQPGGDYGGAWRWMKTGGDNRPLCGGASRATNHSGVLFLGLTHSASEDYHLSGFRCAYAELT